MSPSLNTKPQRPHRSLGRLHQETLLAVLCVFVFGSSGLSEEKRGPLPPPEALKTFRVPAGFRVELVASEPQVASPVAIAFDEDGRLYVAEMRDYPLGSPSGSIRLLEESLKVQLLERHARGMVPTVFGRALAEHARVIRSELRHAVNEINALRGS